VYFNPAPDRLSTRQVQVCFEEEPYHTTLDAENPGSTYQWAHGPVSQRVNVNEYGWHAVEITNIFGCTFADSIHVVEYCPSTIFAPNTFTPNGDGTNDVFLPVGRNIAAMRLTIFDRWGAIVFHTDDMNTGWDGTHKGEFVTDDVYVWRMKYRYFEDRTGRMGMEKEMTGHIQVLR
jgi:gliding motility-associated-like protein